MCHHANRAVRLLVLLGLAVGSHLGLASTACAALLSYDGFNYPTGSIAGDNGGTGWSNAWSGPGTVLAQTLSDPSGTLVTSPGSVQDTGATDRNSQTTFGTPGTTLWASFLMQPNSTGSYGGLNLGDLFIGDIGGVYGLNTNGGGGSVDTSDHPVLNQTAFFVVEINFAAGNDTAELFMNPTPGNIAPVTPDAVKTDHDLGSFSLAYFETGNAYTFDELRLGTTFADVAPAVPEPGSVIALIGLCGMGLIGLVIRRRRRKS